MAIGEGGLHSGVQQVSGPFAGDGFVLVEPPLQVAYFLVIQVAIAQQALGYTDEFSARLVDGVAVFEGLPCEEVVHGFTWVKLISFKLSPSRWTRQTIVLRRSALNAFFARTCM
jgi:hypothetical protein